jgi:energy-coupling factor transport system permease protein
VKTTSFDKFHPVIAALYFAAMAILCMATIHPVVISISLVGSIATSIAYRGLRATLKTLAWQLPLALIIAIFNVIFSGSGSTVLFSIGTTDFYLEAFLYGLTIGAMLITVMLVFSNATQVLSSDKIMLLCGRVFPVIGLMMTMIMRLVPQFVRRGSEISAVAGACTAASPSVGDAPKRKTEMNGAVRQLSVLMGWSMEDSLETSAAMRARGWGACERRTQYKLRTFRTADALMLVMLHAIIAFAIVACISVTSGFVFYPRLSAMQSWWLFIPVAIVAFAPAVAECIDILYWRNFDAK